MDLMGKEIGDGEDIVQVKSQCLVVRFLLRWAGKGTRKRTAPPSRQSLRS